MLIEWYMGDKNVIAGFCMICTMYTHLYSAVAPNVF